MHPSVVRQVHASRIFHAVRLTPFMSQREIAAKSGADKSTVSAIIREFEAGGLIVRTREATGGGRGRPGERIAICPKGGLLVGVHPRPQEVRFVAASLDGHPIGTLARPMPEDPRDLPSIVAAGIRDLKEELRRGASETRAVGLSISGLVTSQGHLAQSPNLGWRDVPLRALLRDAVPGALYIGNSSNASAIAERMFGHGIAVDDFLYVESGSGVGGGLVLDGSLYGGGAGFAGEIGHLKVVPDGRPCRCGGRGCLSAYLAEHALVRHLKAQGSKAESTRDVLALAQDGDGTVLSALEEAGGHLGLALANLVNLFNPPLIILGGGLAHLAPYLTPAMRRVLEAASLPSPLAACEVRISAISLEPVPRGGIALALEGCTSLAASEHAPW